MSSLELQMKVSQILQCMQQDDGDRQPVHCVLTNHQCQGYQQDQYSSQC